MSLSRALRRGQKDFLVTDNTGYLTRIKKSGKKSLREKLLDSKDQPEIVVMKTAEKGLRRGHDGDPCPG